jgi:uroporphyrinogen decarboxylase
MHLIEKMVQSGVDALSLDSPETGVNLPEVAELVSQDTVIIGNISPTGVLLNGRPEDVEKEVTELLKSMENYPNFVLSTGCDLPQETPLENIDAFMRTGRNYSLNG